MRPILSHFRQEPLDARYLIAPPLVGCVGLRRGLPVLVEGVSGLPELGDAVGGIRGGGDLLGREKGGRGERGDRLDLVVEIVAEA